MKKLILISAVLVSAFLSFSQDSILNVDEEKLIKAIYPLYEKDIADSGWVNYFDQDFQATISATQVIQFSEESSTYIAIINWRAIQYSYGEMVEFYIIKQTKDKIIILAKPSENSGRIYYGGGTQRYGDPEVTKNIKFSDNEIYGFEVEQGSYHFASGTEETTVYLFAIINNEIKEVLSLNLDFGFSAFSLKEIKEAEDDTQIQDLNVIIKESVPQEYMRDEISETESSYEILNTETNEMFDISVNKTTYLLSDNKIKEEVNLYYYKWAGESYKKWE